MLDVVLTAWNCWAGVRGSGKDQVVLGLCTSAAEEQTLHYAAAPAACHHLYFYAQMCTEFLG